MCLDLVVVVASAFTMRKACAKRQSQLIGPKYSQPAKQAAARGWRKTLGRRVRRGVGNASSVQ